MHSIKSTQESPSPVCFTVWNDLLPEMQFEILARATPLACNLFCLTSWANYRRRPLPFARLNTSALLVECARENNLRLYQELYSYSFLPDVPIDSCALWAASPDPAPHGENVFCSIAMEHMNALEDTQSGWKSAFSLGTKRCADKYWLKLEHYTAAIWTGIIYANTSDWQEWLDAYSRQKPLYRLGSCCIAAGRLEPFQTLTAKCTDLSEWFADIRAALDTYAGFAGDHFLGRTDWQLDVGLFSAVMALARRVYVMPMENPVVTKLFWCALARAMDTLDSTRTNEILEFQNDPLVGRYGYAPIKFGAIHTWSSYQQYHALIMAHGNADVQTAWAKHLYHTVVFHSDDVRLLDLASSVATFHIGSYHEVPLSPRLIQWKRAHPQLCSAHFYVNPLCFYLPIVNCDSDGFRLAAELYPKFSIPKTVISYLCAHGLSVRSFRFLLAHAPIVGLTEMQVVAFVWDASRDMNTRTEKGILKRYLMYHYPTSCC